MNKDHSQPILVLGPMSNRKNTIQVGGIIILFQNYIDWLRRKEIKYDLIDLNKTNYINRFIAWIIILYRLLIKIPYSKSVSIHGTANDFIYIAPFAVFYSKLFHKKVVLRKFAGNFDLVYSNLHGFRKKMVRYALANASALLFETKHLVAFGAQFNLNSHWLPNVRNKPVQNILIKHKEHYSCSFVFISQVSKEKGVLDLVDVFKQLPLSYKLFVYGPLIDLKSAQLESPNIVYGGVIDHGEVFEKLSQHDYLLLPSYREGYPGIIIEAFSVGTPVIASSVGGIPEILQHNVQGLLFEPGNTQQLKELILSLDVNCTKQYSINSLASFDNYDADKVYSKIKDLII